MLFGRRQFRHKTIIVLISALLFSQMALANYLCPAQAPSPSMTEMMAAGAPCEGMDEVQPALCHQHVADPGQAVQVAQVVTPSLPAIIQVLLVPAVQDARDAVAIPEASTPEAQPPPDPVFLSTLRLRV